MPEAEAVFFLVTVLGLSIEVQQTGDNYASLAKCRKKMKAVNSPYTGSVHSQRGKKLGRFSNVAA